MDRSVGPFLVPFSSNTPSSPNIGTKCSPLKRGRPHWSTGAYQEHSPLLTRLSLFTASHCQRISCKLSLSSFCSKMSNGAIAIARIDGQIALVQGKRSLPPMSSNRPRLTPLSLTVVRSSRISSHVEVIKYTLFGDRHFLANFTSSPPSSISSSDILQVLPSSIKPSGDTLTLPNDIFSQFIACTTANQQELEARWARAIRGGAVSLR